MLRGHIAYQQGEQAARPLRNKCRDRAAWRPYIRLRSLAYVTGNQPRGSNGSPPEQGAQALRIKPNTCQYWTLAYARVSPVPGPRCGPNLTRRDLDPIQGARHVYLGISDRNLGSGLCAQGSGSLLWRSGPTDTSWDVSSFSRHVVPLGPSTRWGRVLSTMRLEDAVRAPRLYTVVRGTPDSGYRQMSPLIFQEGFFTSFGNTN
jgi:hypothetical protein